MRNPQIIAIISIIIILILTSRSTLEDLRLFTNSLNTAQKQEQKQEQKENNTKPVPKETVETKKRETPKPKPKEQPKKETPKPIKPKQVQTPKPIQKPKVKEPVQKSNYYDSANDYEFELLQETYDIPPATKNMEYQPPQTKKSKFPKLQFEVNYTPDNKFSDIKLVPRF